MKLTGEDILKAHLELSKGLYRSEAEIREREAEILNKILRAKEKP